MYGYIYLTTNLINNKKYIGQHKASEFDPNYKGSGTYLWNAINKYGWDNFKCEIIKECFSSEELNKSEIEEIQKRKATTSDMYYNITSGGEGGWSYVNSELENPTKDSIWITNGIDNKRVQKDSLIPEGWSLGVTKFSNQGLIEITNGLNNKYISPEDPIPKGWWRGSTQSKPNTCGENNPMYGKIWITNGAVNSLISKDDPIPDGWRRGATQNNPDQHGKNSSIFGRRSITNGKENKLISPSDPVPEGWKYGQVQDHTGQDLAYNRGRIYITNGVNNRLIYPEETIPDGWRVGMTRKRRRD